MKKDNENDENPYESPPQAAAVADRNPDYFSRSVILTLEHLFIAVIVLVQLVAIVPTFMYFFEHERIGLPWPTLIVCFVSLQVVKFWYLWFPAWLLLDFGLLFVLGRQRDSRWSQRIWHEVVLLSTIGFLFASTGVMLIPCALWYRT